MTNSSLPQYKEERTASKELSLVNKWLNKPRYEREITHGKLEVYVHKFTGEIVLLCKEGTKRKSQVFLFREYGSFSYSNKRILMFGASQRSPHIEMDLSGYAVNADEDDIHSLLEQTDRLINYKIQRSLNKCVTSDGDYDLEFTFIKDPKL